MAVRGVSILVLGLMTWLLATSGVLAGVTRGSVNMRSGPGTNHGVIAVVPRGAGVDVHDCVTKRGWCRIEWRGRSGWIAQRLLDDSLPGLNMGVAATPPGGTALTIELHVRQDDRSPSDPEYGMSPPRIIRQQGPLSGPDRQWRALQQRRAIVRYWFTR